MPGPTDIIPDAIQDPTLRAQALAAQSGVGAHDLPWRPRYQDVGSIALPGAPPPAAPPPGPVAGAGVDPAAAAPTAPPPPTPPQIPMAESTTRTIGPKISAKDERLMTDAEKAQEQAVKDQTRASVDTQAAQADVYKQQMAQQEKDAADARAQEAQRKATFDSKMGEVSSAVDDLKNSKIDPQRYWKNLGAPKQIGMALSMALGAFGASLSKGPNFALDIFNKHVDEDIAAQREEIAKRKDLVGLKNNQLGQLMQRGLDERQAESALRSLRLQGFETQVKQTMAASGSQQAQAAGNAILAQTQAKFAQEKTNLDLSTQDRVVKQTTPVVTDPQKEQSLSVVINGKSLKAPTPEVAQKLRDQAAGLEEFRNKAAEYKKLVASSGTNLIGTKKAQLQGLQNDMQLAYLRAQGINRLSGGELEIAKTQFSDATGISNANSQSIDMVNRVSDRLQAGLIENLKSSGMISGKQKD